jgi:Amt family ammonium transporter
MDSGNLSWYIVATALVLLMTPGVAFFYGGLVRAKSVVSMMMMSFGAMGVVAVLWILYGFSMQNVSTGWVGFVGNPLSDFGLGDLASGGSSNVDLVGVAFGATFAIITVALISGAIADRAKFGAWMAFVALFVTFDYFLVAGWVWNPDGWIATLGTHLGLSANVIDYAGGTAVHINAGAAALALALVLGKRVGFSKDINRPHNVPLVLLGAALLWFGWFGFNGGAAAAGDGIAASGSPIGLITINTLGATAAAILGWLVIEKLTGRKPTSVGAASGAVAGLVAITPACANLTPGWSLLLGLIAGIVCAKAVELKYLLRIDDSLDVVGVHLVGGLIGTLYLGFFATGTGLFTGGSADQLIVQTMAALSVLVFSFGISWAVGWGIQKTMGFRIRSEDELAGVDTAVHGESGYAFPEEASTGPVAVQAVAPEPVAPEPVLHGA